MPRAPGGHGEDGPGTAGCNRLRPERRKKQRSWRNSEGKMLLACPVTPFTAVYDTDSVGST